MPRWQSITPTTASSALFDDRVFSALRGRLAEQLVRDDLGPCWVTDFHINHHGYAQKRHMGRMMLVHRVAYTVAIGPIPVGLHVLHHCDNRACCRPSHLWLGTDLDNARDRDSKCRRNVRGSQMGTAKLTEPVVEEVLDRIEAGESLASIARSLGVTNGPIHHIKTGRSWRHCGDPDRRERIASERMVCRPRPWRRTRARVADE